MWDSIVLYPRLLMYSAKSSAIRFIFPDPFTCMGRAIQIRCPVPNNPSEEAKTSLTSCSVVDFSVLDERPYGGSVITQSTLKNGGFRESASTSPSAEMLKKRRFFLVPKIIRFCASTPTARQPM